MLRTHSNQPRWFRKWFLKPFLIGAGLFAASVFTAICMEVPFNQPFSWVLKMGVHWILLLLTLVVATLLWKPMRHDGAPVGGLVQTWLFVTPFLFFIACGITLWANTLSFHGLRPFLGNIDEVHTIKPYRGKPETWIDLRIINSSELLRIRLKADEVGRLQKGDTYSRNLRPGLVGIPWRWTWE